MDSNVSRLKILFVSSPNKNKCFIREALKNTDYEIFEARTSQSGIQKTLEYLPDLIICENELDGYSGFQMYNNLKDTLIKEGILFFIYSDNFDKEDILIGLEMGVDNFIISPVNEKALIEKIERQVRKMKDLKIAEIKQFKTFLESTPIAKFVVFNNRIDYANEAFYNLVQVPDEKKDTPLITDIFNIAENSENAVNYKKCLHGFISHCRLNRVSSNMHFNHYFDIFLHYHHQNGKGSLFAEVTRSLNVLPVNGNGFSPQLKNQYKAHTETQNIKFTKREKQILEYSVQGLPIKQIAEKLGLSQRTIEKHRSNIIKKTKTNNIIEAIYVAQGTDDINLQQKQVLV